jgi:hypothetical protein
MVVMLVIRDVPNDLVVSVFRLVIMIMIMIMIVAVAVIITN